MYFHLVEMDDIGSYKDTYEHTLRNYISKDPIMMAKNSGIKFDSEGSMFSLS